MIDTGATTNLIEVNLVPRLRLQVAKANLVVGFTSHHQVVPNGIAMANLSVGTWAQDTSFVVMAMSRYNVILGMEFLYNAKVHVHPHLSCIWIGGMKEPCMVECEYLNANRLEPSLQTTNGGLVGGNSAMMSLVEQCVQVVEGLDEYTTMSRGFVAGESLGPQLNKLPDIDMDQGEGELEAKSLGEDSDYWKTHHNENVGDILSGTSNNEYLLNKGDYGCFKEEAWGFRHFKLESRVPVITSLWAIWFMMQAGAEWDMCGCQLHGCFSLPRPQDSKHGVLLRDLWCTQARAWTGTTIWEKQRGNNRQREWLVGVSLAWSHHGREE
ncbi:hypothetical protein WN943_025104 [Citrus x changshan-huyou]